MLGDKLDIMKKGWLNLIFANRNQAYGAYQLRKENARNTSKALAIAITFFIVILASPTIANIIKGYIPAADPLDHTTIVKLLPPPTIAPVVPPPAREPARPHNPTVEFPPPVVRPDDPNQQDPPTDDKLKTVDPGTKTQEGHDDAPLTVDQPAGTGDPNNGVTEGTNENTVFTAVEVEPGPIGGMEKFYSFLGNKMKYPNAAKEAGTQGRVVLTFVVEKDGSLTDIKPMRDPGNGLGDEAIRVLKLAPHWTPGIQNGKKVRVQFTIPINFTLGEQ